MLVNRLMQEFFEETADSYTKCSLPHRAFPLPGTGVYARSFRIAISYVMPAS